MTRLRDEKVPTIRRRPDSRTIIHSPPTAVLEAVVELTRSAFHGNLSVHYDQYRDVDTATLFHCDLDAIVLDHGHLVCVGVGYANKNSDFFTKVLRHFDMADPASTPEAIAAVAIELLTPEI